MNHEHNHPRRRRLIGTSVKIHLVVAWAVVLTLALTIRDAKHARPSFLIFLGRGNRLRRKRTRRRLPHRCRAQDRFRRTHRRWPARSHRRLHLTGVQSIQLRWIGHRLHAETSVEVDENLDLYTAHDIAHAAEEHLRRGVPKLSEATVHVGPQTNHARH